MALIYVFILVWVSVNGITSPFNDVGSFFMWAAVLLPVFAGILFLFLGDNDPKN